MAQETNPSEKLRESIEDLDQNIEDLDTKIEELTNRFGFWPTLGRGIIGAVGAALGASLVIGFLVYLMQLLTGLPVVGTIFDGILGVIQQNK